jgi:hypothetical protein
MDNGMWWGLIKNGNLVALKRSSIEPATFDFGCYLSTEHVYEVIPVKILPDTY